MCTDFFRSILHCLVIRINREKLQVPRILVLFWKNNWAQQNLQDKVQHQTLHLQDELKCWCRQGKTPVSSNISFKFNESTVPYTGSQKLSWPTPITTKLILWNFPTE